MAVMHMSAEADYMAGMKYQEIADKHGVSLSTVKSWKLRYKWDRKSKKSAKKSTQPKKNKVCTSKVKSTQPANPPKVAEPKKPKQRNYQNKLTEKQKLFCLYYVKNHNATLAYQKAFGCSYDVANSEGYKMLVVPCVKAEVQKLKELKYQSIDVSEQDIVERMMRIGFADMTDVAEWGSREVVRHDEDGNKYVEAVNYLDFKNHDKVDGGLISEIKLGKQGMSVKLESRDKALKWLADYFGANPMSKHKMQYDNAILAIRQAEAERNNF